MFCTHCGGKIKNSDPIVDVCVRVCRQALTEAQYTGVSYHPRCFPGSKDERARVNDKCRIVGGADR